MRPGLSSPPEGLLLVSIDCQPDRHACGDAELIQAARSLADLLGQYRISATWALADPANSPLPNQILRLPASQRIALLAEPHWAGEQAGRTRFARELTRRVEAAAASTIPLGTMALRGFELREHLDLLVRHRLAVVRGSGTRASGVGTPLETYCERFGIWQSEATCRFPESRRWLGIFPVAPKQAVAGGMARKTWTHLLLDVPTLARSSRTAWGRLERCLAFAERQMDAGRLTCVTLERLAQHCRADRGPHTGSAVSHRAA
jgi:hypothetical protein